MSANHETDLLGRVLFMRTKRTARKWFTVCRKSGVWSLWDDKSKTMVHLGLVKWRPPTEEELVEIKEAFAGR